MSVEVVNALIDYFESDISDSVINSAHSPTCLKTLLNWTDSDLRIYHAWRPLALKVPEILIQMLTGAGDHNAPGYKEGLAARETYQITLLAADPTTLEKIHTRVVDLIKNWNSIPSRGRRLYSFDLVSERFWYDEDTKTARKTLSYRVRSIATN